MVRRELKSKKPDTATLNRLNDRLFKYIFASEQNKDLLIRFLNDVLGEDKKITSLEFIDREFDPFLLEGKTSHFDVRAKTGDGRSFLVEVQIVKEHDFFRRCLYYVSNIYITQIRSGDAYSSLEPVIFVGILDFEMFEDAPFQYHSIHKIMDTQTHRCHCDSIEFHFLEIPKLRKLKKIPQTGLERLLTYMGSIGGAESMKELAKVDSDIDRILRLEEIFIKDPSQWVDYLMRERAKTDYEHSLNARLKEVQEKGMQTGMEKGMKTGMEKGIRAKAVETARNLLAMNLTVENIAKATGLSEDEVRSLRTEPNK